MEVLGLVGSPRRGGNTDILVDAVLGGARAHNHTVAKSYVRDFDIGPCVDCRGCKKGEWVCVPDDGMKTVQPMKQLVDRLRPFVANGRFKGKRGVVVAAGEVLGTGYDAGDVLRDERAMAQAAAVGRAL